MESRSRAIALPRPHDLLRLNNIYAIVPDDAPSWVNESIRMLPWVVTRRAMSPTGFVSVGIRGATRSQRFGFVVPAQHVDHVMTPEDAANAAVARWGLPAFRTLSQLRPALNNGNFPWGPVGSVGHELVTGAGVVGPDSDLDLVVRVDFPDRAIEDALVALHTSFCDRPARVDCLVETRSGAFSLTEFVSGSAHLLLRNASGASLVDREELIA